MSLNVGETFKISSVETIQCNGMKKKKLLIFNKMATLTLLNHTPLKTTTSEIQGFRASSDQCWGIPSL